MSTYELLLFAHILAAATWVGGGIAAQALALRALGGTPQQMVEFMRSIEWFGTRVQIPASLAVLVFGLLLVGDRPEWELGQTWIVLALAGFGYSFVTGAGFLGPETGRIGELIAQRGEEDSEVQRRIRRILVVSRVELAVLVGILLLMVLKPGV